MNKSDDLANLSDDEIMNIDDTQENFSEPETEKDNEPLENTEDNSDVDNQENEQDVDQEPENNTQELSPEYYKEFYHKIMAPFKADGTMVTPENENDVISLMQKGVNYTKKMQSISAQRKAISALEREGMLTNEQLSYMIDLKNGNPDAIRKLLKDNQDKFDIYDMDLDDVRYTPNQIPEEDEAYTNFNTALEEISSSPEGTAVINDSAKWDGQTKSMLYQNPNYLRTMVEQRKSGIYQRILSEIENMEALGRFAPNTPFLQKYSDVGNKLIDAGVIQTTSQPNQQQYRPQQQIITKGPAQTSNYNRARSAGIARSSHGNTNMVPNPAAMSDEDFLKAFAQRI